MSESFAQLLEESLENVNMAPGSIIKGTVVQVQRDFALVDAGLKSEALIPLNQFKDEKGEITLQVGDEVDVALDAVENSAGETLLSREKAKRAEVWTRLETASEAGNTVIGMITGRVKGGFTVDLETVRAFLPGSLVDVRPLRDTAFLEGKNLEFKVIKIDAKRNNVVVSRRAVIEEENSSEREELLENLHEGQVIKGVVKNLTDYGAFVDLGGIDGLLHITDMSWKRIKHPSELVAVGDEIDVKVLKFDREKARVSLGLKQLGEDPWVDVINRFPEGKKLVGRVTNIADYGCFVELDNGIEGLVHVSEMDWTNKNVSPSKIVQLNQEVQVVVLDIDEERRRISLGLKQCIENPWANFANTHNKGDVVKGKIRSITDFGIFIGLDGDIDGLVHLSDISWSQAGEEAVREFSKGDEIEAVVLAIDIDRERVSLGVKQLSDDPLGSFTETNRKGDIVTGKVVAVDEAGAEIELDGEMKGYVKASDIAAERIADASKHLKVGDEIEACFMGLDRKKMIANLSIKAKDAAQEKAATKAYREKSKNDIANATLGDLLKEQIGDEAE